MVDAIPELQKRDIEAFHYEQWKDQFAQDYDPANFPLRYERIGYDWVAIEPWINIQFASTFDVFARKRLYAGRSRQCYGDNQIRNQKLRAEEAPAKNLADQSPLLGA